MRYSFLKTKFMKHLLLLLFVTTLSLSSFSIGISDKKPPMAAEISIPIGDGKSINLQQLADMSVRDFEQLSDRKMNLADKITFKLGQKKLRDNILPDGTLKNKMVAKYFADGEPKPFHIGGFALGFFAGLIGVLIAYLIKDDNRYRRRKWAWIGWLVFLAVYIALSVAL